MERRRRRSGRRRLGVLTLVLALLASNLVGAAAWLASRADDGAPRSPGRGPAARALPDPSASGSANPGLDERPDRVLAVTDLLARRSRAVLTGDRAAFLATADPQSPAFVAAQGRLFDALRAVPLARWDYQLEPAGERPLPAAVRARYGGAATWAPGLTLRYRLAGFDGADALLPQRLTFVRRPAGWFAAADSDFAAVGPRPSPGLWDLGPVRVVRGARSLVLGHPARADLLRALAREADAAVPRVTAVWGPGWSQRVVLLVPHGHRELGALLGETGDLARIAAVATAESERSGAGGADRVVVNPGAFDRLTALGRRVVLTHEVTHVATRAVTTAGMPSWLVEGFADYVGYRDTRARVSAAARELRHDLRTAAAPAGLPANTDFHAGNPRLSQAYQAAWLACRLVATRWGEDSLVRLYRTVGAAGARLGSDQGQAVAAGLRSVLGIDPPAFTVEWRTYLSRELR